MSKTSLLKKLNRALSPYRADFSSFDREVQNLKQKLEATVNLQTVEDVKYELNKFKQKINLEPLKEEVGKLRDNLTAEINRLEAEIEQKTEAIESLQKQLDSDGVQRNEAEESLKTDLVGLRSSLLEVKNNRLQDLKNLEEIKKDLTESEKSFTSKLKEIGLGLQDFLTKKENEQTLQNLKKEINSLKIDLLNRISSVGGGNANRSIRVGGVDYLTRYNDLNLIAGTNVTLTVANDDTNRRVNITFAASGGGLNLETPTGSVDDSNLTFTVTHEPKLINVNGALYSVGTGLYLSYLTGTITLSAPVGLGGFIISIY